ncbi:alanine racemase [Thioclava sp. SK-1]|uniref:alanine racemase n=1 Tax=Thioclava sp. SK-1 TaxID=1889770 RepID=UPI0008247A29|nr:alanine racemase [Thioclava sp. SK-1]OCX67143.1 alanine racemase [Thioclava sp. SK-1]
MAQASLHINLDAITANWRALNAKSGTATETGAVVKADSYGLGAGRVSQALMRAGVRTFFVAIAEEGAALRKAIGDGPKIYVFSGHMEGDAPLLQNHSLIALLNSPQQVQRHFSACSDTPFGIQLDTGMNRLGLEAAEWSEIAPNALALSPKLIMSHLACSDELEVGMNERQLPEFLRMTQGVNVPRSLSATGGILLGPEFHFDITRPGVGLYGGMPFDDAQRVVTLSLPVIQTRSVAPGETVGYGNTWTAQRHSVVATVAAGYADGIHRILSNRTQLWADGTACPVIGRVSMDLITVDVTDLAACPDALDLLGKHQTVDDLAAQSGTIGYEVLTSLGTRYNRSYHVSGA